MAHLVNHIHENMGFADPDGAEESMSWAEMVPVILAGLRTPETFMQAVELMRRMADAADGKEKGPGH